jgi:hypothetical protein
MRVHGWALSGVLCTVMAGGGAAVAAAQGRQPAAGPRGPAEAAQSARTPAPSAANTEAAADDDGAAVTDDVIVEVMLRTERVVQRTAAIGAKRPTGGDVRDVARRVHSSTGEMLGRLETYARRHGYPVRAARADADADAEVEAKVSEMLGELDALETAEFNPTFLIVFHDLCQQMLALLAGAQEAATDPALRALVRERAVRLSGEQRQLETLILEALPPPPRGPARGRVPGPPL